VPRLDPCGPILDNSLEDPFSVNPAIPTVFDNFIGWKNNRNCFISERTGRIELRNFKCVENKLAGIEFSLTDLTDKALVRNAVLVGKS